MKRLLMLLVSVLLVSLLIAGCGTKDANSGNVPPATVISNESGEVASSQSGLDSDESDGFRAQVTSAISVNLAWDPVEGASGYRIDNQFADSEWFKLAEVDSSQTTYEDFLTPSNMELNYRLTPITGSSEGRALLATVTTPEVVPNPYAITVKLEEPDYNDIGLEIPGFDPSTFDPSTFDPSSLDLSGFDAENLDLSSLGPKPVSAVALIGSEGGSLSVTGKNGITYTLDIPPQALDFGTYFTLTPVAEIDGYPFSGGYYGAVQIWPEGIVFDAPVTITFTFPEGVGPGNTGEMGVLPVAFAFERGGEEFHLKPHDYSSAGISGLPGGVGGKLSSPARQVLQQMATSTNVSSAVGAGGATGAEQRNYASTHPTTNPADAAAQNSAANQADDELAPLENPGEATKEQKAKQEEERQRALRRAAAIEQEMKRAAGNLLSLSRLIDGDFKDFYNYGLDFYRLSTEEQEHIFQTAAILLFNVLESKKCPSDEANLVQAWARRLRNPVSDFDKNLRKPLVSAYPVELDQRLKLLEAVYGCAVKLIFQSTVTFDISNQTDSCRYELTVVATVPLSWKFDGRDVFLQGGAETKGGETIPNLRYVEPIKVLSRRSDGKIYWCTDVEYDTLGKSTITVVSLVPVYDDPRGSVPGEGGGNSIHTDWTLRWTGGGDVHESTTTMTDKDGNTYSAKGWTARDQGDIWGGAMAGMALSPGVGGYIGDPKTSGHKWELLPQPENGASGRLAQWDPEGDRDGYLILADTKMSHNTRLWLETQ